MRCKNIVRNFLNTDSKDYGIMITRIMLWIVTFAHGGQKLFGLWGWPGFEWVMWFFTTNVGLPYIIALLIVLWESLWALALIIGFMTRFMAFGIFLIMAWAIILVHWANGFYIDWFNTWAPQGMEFHLLAVAMALTILIRWWWAFSLDTLIRKYFTSRV